MKKINLTQGEIALVDDETYNYLNQFRWHTSNSRGMLYAVRPLPRNKQKQKHIKMHREIMGLTNPELKIDHIDHNGLNNQKNNLRVCSQQENNRNSRPKSLKLKGISWHIRNKKWTAQIRYNHKLLHIGSFGTQEEAALAYNQKAKELFGKFACLNELPNQLLEE